jgi:hypothetical protein
MKIRDLASWIFVVFISSAAYPQDIISQFNYWQYYTDIENSLYKSFCSTAFDQLKSRQSEIQELDSKQDWLARQSLIKEKLRKISGPFPDKTPLNVKITGKLKMDGYTVEKLIYESFPGYYVTAALYIPDGVKKKAPAIFYVCGHTPDGFRAGTYQHIIVNLVMKGFVVFTIDPMGQGERYEYWDKENNQPKITIPDHEHSYAGAQCLISGYSTARYFIWDAMRGIDYMLTRKEIDPDRIGMTGRSGGGNITAYLGALDERIHAAAPECYITGYEYIYKSIGPQCAEQNLYKMIHEGLDHADFIEARAPKPTLIIGTTRDFFSIQGTLDSFDEARKMYRILDAENKLSIALDDTVHKSTAKNREAMYAFFQKYLDNPGSPLDMEVEVPDPEELKVTQTGQIATAFSGKTIFSMNETIVRSQVANLDTKRINTSGYLSKIPNLVTEYAGFNYPDEFGRPVFSGRFVRNNYTLEKYLIPGSDEYVLPVALFKPKKDMKGELILMVHSDGMKAALKNDSLVNDLIGAGFSVLLCDLPGIGSMGPGYLKGDSYIQGISFNQWFAAILTGRSHIGLWAEDLIRIVNFTKGNLKDFSKLSAMAIGPVGGALLHAAILEPAIKQISLISPLISYSELAMTRLYNPEYIPYSVAGAIVDYDLSDLIAGLHERKIIIVNPLSGDGTKLEDEKLDQIMAFPRKVFIEKGRIDNLQLKFTTDVQDLRWQSILNWQE